MKELMRRLRMADYEELDLGYVGEGGGTVDSVNGIGPDEYKNVQIRFFVTDEWWKNAERPLPAGRYIIIDGGGEIGPLINQRIADHNEAGASHPDKAKRYSKTYPVPIAAGEFTDYIRITEIAGSIALSDESEITETGSYQYHEPVEITGISGTFTGNGSITVDYDLSDLVEKVDGEITERKKNEAGLAAALQESYQKALKNLSETTQSLFSNIALKTYTEPGTGQIKAYQLLGTAINGTIHTLIELAQYGSLQQVEIGSESIHLNLNTTGGEGIDNHITVDTHDEDDEGVKLSLAYLTDVVNQCAQALQSAKAYADEKDAALRVDSLIIQPPCNESDLPPYDPENPWDPSHNGYWYQIEDFDVSRPGYKGTATWYDDLGEGEPGYYLAADNYGHADGTTTKEDEEGQISVNDITQKEVTADTNPFTALEKVSFLSFIRSVIRKINGVFQLTASINTMLEYKAGSTQDIAEPDADTETPGAVENETIPHILQKIWDFIAGRVPVNRSFGGLALSEDRSAADVKNALNITNFADDAEVADDNLHAALNDADASTALPETGKKEIRSLLQAVRNNLKAIFSDGFATDVRIGSRILEDQAGSSTLISVEAKKMTVWLQGIRNNLKALFTNKVDKNGTDRLMTAAEGKKLAGIANFYKGANNQAGMLVNLGAATASGEEIIFEMLYNETQSGNLVRQAHIHGQLYGSIDSRHGMVQNGNTPVQVYAFKGTEEGIGSTNTYLWIPNSNTAYFPSVRAEAWSKSSAGPFDKLPVTVSTIPAVPVEALTEIAYVSG
jgi:hypothetical protein